MKYIIVLFFTILCFEGKSQTLENCSNCSTQVVKEEQIKGLSIDEIRFLTNDLFARKGYKFQSADVDNYYSDKVWYKPVTDNNKLIFSDVEKQNVKLFQDRTTEIKKEREKLITELKNFKSAILKKDNSELYTRYGYSTVDKEYKHEYKYLTEAVTKINLDDVNWSFDIGMYKVTVDNGDFVMNYEIRISPDGFSIKYGNQGGSEIGKQIYPNDQITEFAFWWEFEWKNNRIKFIKIDMAG
ncbi:MAG: hypothetical protein K0R36_3509 [Chryseobacterium sp.]|jgi:hypothetical protein|nr:hypothetical protein [Chryseobacterium sp.]